jgi:hypothetical protein
MNCEEGSIVRVQFVLVGWQAYEKTTRINFPSKDDLDLG